MPCGRIYRGCRAFAFGDFAPRPGYDRSALRAEEARSAARTAGGLGGWSVPQVGQGRGVWDSEAARVARATAASIARLSRKTAMMSTDSSGLGFFGFGDMRGFLGGVGEAVRRPPNLPRRRQLRWLRGGVWAGAWSGREYWFAPRAQAVCIRNIDRDNRSQLPLHS